MSEMTLIVPNDWVTEEKLVEITGLRPGTIERARKMLDGRPGIPSCLPDGIPKKTANACTTAKLSTSGLRASKKQPGARQ
jgi:hypothetical protein